MSDKRLGPYRLIRLLGRGGMAEVYLATTEAVGGFRKRLAVKLLLPRFAADKELVALLADEARVSIWLNHPQIVQVFDFGRDGPSYYLALEYVDGCDLRALVRHARGSSEARGRALPLPTALFVALRVLEALDHAHRRCDPRGRPLEIIHRDVSPHNILISRAGEVKLADFGLARAAISVHQTQSGIVRGKFAFMPPEQAHAQVIDQRIDLFAAGATLYQALTGIKPYTSVTLPQQLYQLARALPPPSTHAPGLPPEVDALTLRALALRADDRYPSAAAMVEDLARALERHGGGDEQRRLAALVSSAAPPSAEPDGDLPALSIADVRVPQQSLIGDAIVAAQHTLAAEPERSRRPASAPARPAARVPEAPRQSGAGREAAPGAERVAPSRSNTEEDLRALDASASRAQGAAEPGRHDSRQIDAVHGVINRQRAPSSRRGRAEARAPLASRHAAAAPGARLVQALRQARDSGGGRRRRERHGVSASWAQAPRPPAREQRSAEVHEETQLLRRGRARSSPRALLVLGAAALIMLGLGLGWILRDNLEQPSMLPAGYPLPPAWPQPALGVPEAPAAAESPESRAATDAPNPMPAPDPMPAALDESLPAPPPQRARRGAHQSDRASGAERARSTAAREPPPMREQPPARRAARPATSTTAAADLEPVSGRPSSAPDQGLLRISAERPARAFVDDEPAGATPLRLALSPGIHRVRLVYDDQSSSPVQWIAIEAGQQAKLEF
ncbi:MAG: protein kinase [Proteobacteria bacterium]|nr:protein kinase [Pseudomonadota bacterium]